MTKETEEPKKEISKENPKENFSKKGTKKGCPVGVSSIISCAKEYMEKCLNACGPSGKKLVSRLASHHASFTKMIQESPYSRMMRLDRPIGTWLLVLPILWTVTIASDGFLSWLCNSIFFAFGAFLMRAAGCIVNDIVDSDIDQEVERTKTRPLAAGEITPKEVLALLGILLFIGFIMLLSLPSRVISIGVILLVPVVIYPSIKRHSFYPQIFLGLIFNVGILMSWFSIKYCASVVPFTIYIASVLWTVGYDTIYAFQDVKDDERIEMGSMARALGERAIPIISSLYTVFILMMGFAGFLAGLGIAYYVALVGAAGHLYWQISDVDIKEPQDCGDKFRSNKYVGLIILLGCILG